MFSTSRTRRVGRALGLGGGVLVLVVIILLACTVRVQDRDVTVCSVRPDGRLQVIGLRHRTYLLDYGGRSDVVLFGTTVGTGVLTHGPPDDSCPADRRHDPAPPAPDARPDRAARPGRETGPWPVPTRPHSAPRTGDVGMRAAVDS